jgi:hypothetical protein
MLVRRGGAGAALGRWLLATIVIAVSGCTFPDYAVTGIDDATFPGDDADAFSSIDGDLTDGRADGDARDSSTIGDSTARDGDADAAAGCPVTQLNFTFPSAVKLDCASSTILDVTLPAGTAGLAFARANLTLTHAPIPAVSYHWSAKLEVGADDPERIAFSSGDDLCPGVTTAKVVGGYGKVDAANAHVRLGAFQAAAALCLNGTITVAASSSIDVWIESARPECVGKSIVVASYLELVGPGSVWDWPLGATPAPILTAKIETAASDSSLVTMAMIQGTATTNPNTTCGSETAKLTAQTTLDGTALSTVQQPIPATSGAGHLLLDTFNQGPAKAGVHTVQLVAGRDFIGSKVTTGGTGGDAMLALVRK